VSARDDALRRNAEAGGVNFAPPRPAPPEPRPNLALGRGDVFRPSRARRLEVVVSIEWRGESWAVTTLHFAARGVAGRISSAEPVVRFLPTNGVWKKLGRWDGPLFPGAPGQLIPSDGAATVQGSDSPTDQKEATVATVVRKGKGAKGATKATAAKATPAAAEQPKANGRAARRSAEELEALVPEFVEHLSGGGKMRELKLKHGFSDDGPIRRALYFAGYDSKGAEHGDEADSIDATKAAGKKQLVKLRNEQGAAWYQLAYLSGRRPAAPRAGCTSRPRSRRRRRRRRRRRTSRRPRPRRRRRARARASASPGARPRQTLRSRARGSGARGAPGGWSRSRRVDVERR